MAEIVETSVDDFHVALLRLNQPGDAQRPLGARCGSGSLAELERFDADPEVRCIVIAGSEKIFAAGADIKAMAARALGEPLRRLPAPSSGAGWRRCETPLVAAVAGYALGGGCELALACDMIVADETRPLRPAGDHAWGSSPAAAAPSA